VTSRVHRRCSISALAPDGFCQFEDERTDGDTKRSRGKLPPLETRAASDADNFTINGKEYAGIMPLSADDVMTIQSDACSMVSPNR
jgi:hypothetical protein